MPGLNLRALELSAGSQAPDIVLVRAMKMLFLQLLLSVDVGFEITFPCLRRLALRVEIEMDFDLTDLII